MIFNALNQRINKALAIKLENKKIVLKGWKHCECSFNEILVDINEEIKYINLIKKIEIAGDRDEGIEIKINEKIVYSYFPSGNNHGYFSYTLTPSQIKFIKEGNNNIKVRVANYNGGGGVNAIMTIFY
ncbi:hypothetical protein IO417_000005 [Campylobacter lari]|uniref:hypothetical protein n=1 Tax=Campylobacter lari TaxID=201 RepID=UPI0012763DEE|nr:hypothetical protein [Campylobacter lari]EAK0438918.1 hypothetical protein [Campylobacter lari]EAK0794198.1 hypothetical protein [Campylobacter lari]EAK0795542.1 hypothetical protein [Campylobacter lari]EAK5585225.1 hypothetical protein [Campylobacter lari]